MGEGGGDVNGWCPDFAPPAVLQRPDGV